jgi:16S rRNA (guanine527-N7)-methyltransferase
VKKFEEELQPLISNKVSVQQLHIRGSREGEKRSLLEVNEHFRPTDNKVDGAAERLSSKVFDKESFSNEIKTGLGAIQLEWTPEIVEKFLLFGELLSAWNLKFNLTRIKEEEYIPLHFLDSLLTLKVCPIKLNAKIIDVGTGAGFPGIPMKLLREDLELTLLDARQKKIKFLEVVTRHLAMKKVYPVHSRAEDLFKHPQHAGKYDYVVTRALSALHNLIPLTLPLCTQKGSLLCLKGKNFQDEINASKAILKKHKCAVTAVHTFKLPISEIERCIVKVSRVSSN